MADRSQSKVSKGRNRIWDKNILSGCKNIQRLFFCCSFLASYILCVFPFPLRILRVINCIPCTQGVHGWLRKIASKATNYNPISMSRKPLAISGKVYEVSKEKYHKAENLSFGAWIMPSQQFIWSPSNFLLKIQGSIQNRDFHTKQKSRNIEADFWIVNGSPTIQPSFNFFWSTWEKKTFF